MGATHSNDLKKKEKVKIKSIEIQKDNQKDQEEYTPLILYSRFRGEDEDEEK